MKLERFGLTKILVLAAISASLLTKIAAVTVLDQAVGNETSILETVSIWLGFEGDNSSELTGLLKDNTVRVDPLDNLRRYRGGYNISNKHYWSSTAFTGRSGYIIGTIWLLVGLVYALFLVAMSVCCNITRKRTKTKLPAWSEKSYFRCLSIALLFTLLVVIATGVVLAGSSKFNSRAKTITVLVIETADDAAMTIYNATAALRAIQANVGYSDDSGRLDSTSNTLEQGADTIQIQARKNKRWVSKGLTLIYAVATVLLCANLIAFLALFASGFLRLPRTFYMLLAFCWGMTALFWVAFGFYYFVGKFAGDTCVALEQYQQNPSNSSLSSLLPCDDLRSAKPALLDARAGMHDLIDQINGNLSAQTQYPLLRQIKICNPFLDAPDYAYQPQSCSSDTVQLVEIPRLLNGFTCSEEGRCKNGQFISDSLYNQVSAYTTSLQSMFDALPGMESLADCEPVYKAIKEIRWKHCRPVKKYIRTVWASLLTLSITMMFLISVWMAKDYYDCRGHISDVSVNPHLSTPPYSSDSDNNGVEDKKPLRF